MSEYLVPAVAGRLTSQLVGREAEIRRMTEIVDRVTGGSGMVAFLAGEPGIGKTRLAQSALEAARGRGFQLLQAGASPLEKDLPYALLIAAFKPALRRLNPGQRSAIARDLQHLGLLFADLEQAPPQVLSDPALEKTRLFEDVSRLLDFLAAQSPVALFVDDLHWADSASIELLHYVARGIANQPVLILAAYVPHEADSVRGLRALVRGVQLAPAHESCRRLLRARSSLAPSNERYMNAPLLSVPISAKPCGSVVAPRLDLKLKSNSLPENDAVERAKAN